MMQNCKINSPQARDIELALEKVVSSTFFRKSSQLSSLLRYVVGAAIQGRQLKAYTVAIDALGRTPGFDAQLDPIVRVEATRLRRALANYYAGPGANDSLIIELPRGTYVPTFRRLRNDIEPSNTLKSRIHNVAAHFSSREMRTLAAVVLLAALGILGFHHGFDFSASARRESSISKLSNSPAPLPPGNGMPTIVIEPLRIVGEPRLRSVSPSLLTERLVDAFVRFDTVNIIQNVSGKISDSSSASNSRPFEYHLTSAVEYEDAQTTVSFKLLDTVSGAMIWSREFTVAQSKSEQVRAEEEIVTALTASLLQSYGIIRSRDRAKHLATSSGDPRYRCILEAADAFRSADPGDHKRARSCLEYLTSVDPSFAVGFSFLAAIYLREYQLGFEFSNEQGTALDRAFVSARRAVELNPGSARAHQMLFLVSFSRGDVTGAFAAADRAIDLNKYDLLMVAEYGSRLIMVGETEKGMSLLQQAGDSGAIRPSWHYIYLFLGSYLRDDFLEAGRYASYLPSDNYPLALMAKALMASKTGDSRLKQQSLERLLAIRPMWGINCRRELEKLFRNSEIVERLALDLTIAGLPSADVTF